MSAIAETPGDWSLTPSGRQRRPSEGGWQYRDGLDACGNAEGTAYFVDPHCDEFPDWSAPIPAAVKAITLTGFSDGTNPGALALLIIDSVNDPAGLANVLPSLIAYADAAADWEGNQDRDLAIFMGSVLHEVSDLIEPVRQIGDVVVYYPPKKSSAVLWLIAAALLYVASR